MKILERTKVIASEFTRELEDEELEEFFLSDLTFRLFNRWLAVERKVATLKNLRVFAYLIEDTDALRNISSHVPTEEKDRDYFRNIGFNYEDAYGAYSNTDMKFYSLFELYDEWVKGNHDRIPYVKNGLIANVNRSNGTRDVAQHLIKEADNIHGLLNRIIDIIYEPFSLKLYGVDNYRTSDGNYGGVSYHVNNKYEQYLYDGHTHFRNAMTLLNNGVRQYLGTELVWNDTGHEVKKYSGNWLDKDKAETFKEYGRYEGKEDKGAEVQIVKGPKAIMSFMK